jgi:hypothetical protein
VAELKDSLTQREYLSWQRYWEEEPWGAYRDNLHAGIIAREVRRPQLKKGAENSLDDFMVVNPESRREEAQGNFITLLKMVAKRERIDDRPRKTRRQTRSPNRRLPKES